jgi:hypothetical protein
MPNFEFLAHMGFTNNESKLQLIKIYGINLLLVKSFVNI